MVSSPSLAVDATLTAAPVACFGPRSTLFCRKKKSPFLMRETLNLSSTWHLVLDSRDPLDEAGRMPTGAARIACGAALLLSADAFTSPAAFGRPALVRHRSIPLPLSQQSAGLLHCLLSCLCVLEGFQAPQQAKHRARARRRIRVRERLSLLASEPVHSEFKHSAHTVYLRSYLHVTKYAW